MNIRTLLQCLWACWRFAAGYGLAIVVLLAADLAFAQEQPPPGNPVDVATLPRDLSPWGMFMQADIIVKAVMIGLAIASVVTWTVWLAKTLELIVAKRRLRADLRALAERHPEALQRQARRKSIMGRFLDAAATELGLAAAIPAVVIYNMFSRQIAGYRDLVGDASAEIMRWVSRDLDRHGMGASQRAPTLSAAE